MANSRHKDRGPFNLKNVALQQLITTHDSHLSSQPSAVFPSATVVFFGTKINKSTKCDNFTTFFGTTRPVHAYSDHEVLKPTIWVQAPESKHITSRNTSCFPSRCHTSRPPDALRMLPWCNIPRPCKGLRVFQSYRQDVHKDRNTW